MRNSLAAATELGRLAAGFAEYRQDNERAVAGTSDARSNESADEILVDCGLVTVIQETEGCVSLIGVEWRLLALGNAPSGGCGRNV